MNNKNLYTNLQKNQIISNNTKKPRLKQCTTYSQYIQQILAYNSSINNKLTRSYSIYQDLTLMMKLSSFTIYDKNTFKQIQKMKIIHRSWYSMKQRYENFLYHLTEKNIQSIVDWIDNKSIQGFMYIDSHQQIKIVEKQIKFKEQQSQQLQEVVIIQKDNAFKRPRKESLNEEQQKLQKFKKIIKVQVNPKDQLQAILKLYSKMTLISRKQLIKWFDQLSGSFTDLDTYIETKDNSMLWSKQQDDILINKKVQQYFILKKYKSLQDIQKRKEYLGIL